MKLALLAPYSTPRVPRVRQTNAAHPFSETAVPCRAVPCRAVACGDNPVNLSASAFGVRSSALQQTSRRHERSEGGARATMKKTTTTKTRKKQTNNATLITNYELREGAFNVSVWKVQIT